MKIEDIKKAILGLKPEERARLMMELGPEMYQSFAGNSGMMANMMPSCRTMMKQMWDFSEEKDTKKKG